MKLLREAIQKVGSAATKIPPATELGWRPELWCRAIDILRPNIQTKQGRNGGTFLSSGAFNSIGQLYSAVGERRITPPLRKSASAKP